MSRNTLLWNCVIYQATYCMSALFQCDYRPVYEGAICSLAGPHYMKVHVGACWASLVWRGITDSVLSKPSQMGINRTPGLGIVVAWSDIYFATV